MCPVARAAPASGSRTRSEPRKRVSDGVHGVPSVGVDRTAAERSARRSEAGGPGAGSGPSAHGIDAGTGAVAQRIGGGRSGAGVGRPSGAVPHARRAGHATSARRPGRRTESSKPLKEQSTMKTPRVVSATEWDEAGQELLGREKEHNREGRALAAERRRMPWTAVEKDYRFEGPDGPLSLV